MIAATLDDAVRAFVDDLAPEVEALGAGVDGIDRARLRADVEVEAYNLSCAFIDADGLHTDDELWALIGAFGHRLPSDLGRATPAQVRDAGLLVGRRAHLGQPSALLDVLAGADARDGGGRTERFGRLGAGTPSSPPTATPGRRSGPGPDIGARPGSTRCASRRSWCPPSGSASPGRCRGSGSWNGPIPASRTGTWPSSGPTPRTGAPGPAGR